MAIPVARPEFSYGQLGSTMTKKIKNRREPHRAFKGALVARASPARTTQIPIEEQSSDIRVSPNYLTVMYP